MTLKMRYPVPPTLSDCSGFYANIRSVVNGGVIGASGHRITATDNILYATGATEKTYLPPGLQVPNGWNVQLFGASGAATFKVIPTGITGPSGQSTTPTINGSTGTLETTASYSALLVKTAQDTYILVSPATITSAP